MAEAYNYFVKQLLALVTILTIFLFVGVVYRGVTYKPKPLQKPQRQQTSPIEKNRVYDDEPSTQDTVYPENTPQDQTYTDEYQTDVVVLSKLALNYIYANDFVSLSQLVSPTYGIRINPYYSFTPNDRVISKTEVRTFSEDTNTYFWGTYDGSGFDIQLTNMDYLIKFLTHKDFRTSNDIKYNAGLKIGTTLPITTIINSVEIPNEKRFVEYFVGGTEGNNFNDWESLTLMFIKEDQSWYLYAILHNQWTI